MRWFDRIVEIADNWAEKSRKDAILRQINPEVRPEYVNGSGLKLLLLSLPASIPQSQIFPFHFYSAELHKRWRAQIIEIQIDRWLERPELRPVEVDVVFFQLWIDRTATEVGEIADNIRNYYPSAKLVFLDPFAPTDLRFASALFPYVDFYVKKHVLKDRSLYGRPTFGDTNLSDWYGKHYGLDQQVQRYYVPKEILDKIVLGPSFITAEYILTALVERSRFREGKVHRPINLHARLGGAKSSDWYGFMRRDAMARVGSLSPSWKVLSRGIVGKRKYLSELALAQACFSPFGYGEVCFRDFEAGLYGCALIKPDMSHLETFPNIFIDNETYISIGWDMADLEAALEIIARDFDLRESLVFRTREIMSNYIAEARFVDQIAPILNGEIQSWEIVGKL